MRVLRCLRDLEKWSWIEKMGKNEEKWGKMAAPESPIIHYLQFSKFTDNILNSRKFMLSEVHVYWDSRL